MQRASAWRRVPPSAPAARGCARVSLSVIRWPGRGNRTAARAASRRASAPSWPRGCAAACRTCSSTSGASRTLKSHGSGSASSHVLPDGSRGTRAPARRSAAPRQTACSSPPPAPRRASCSPAPDAMPAARSMPRVLRPQEAVRRRAEQRAQPRPRAHLARHDARNTYALLRVGQQRVERVARGGVARPSAALAGAPSSTALAPPAPPSAPPGAPPPRQSCESPCRGRPSTSTSSRSCASRSCSRAAASSAASGANDGRRLSGPALRHAVAGSCQPLRLPAILRARAKMGRNGGKMARATATGTVTPTADAQKTVVIFDCESDGKPRGSFADTRDAAGLSSLCSARARARSSCPPRSCPASPAPPSSRAGATWPRGARARTRSSRCSRPSTPPRSSSATTRSTSTSRCCASTTARKQHAAQRYLEHRVKCLDLFSRLRAVSGRLAASLDDLLSGQRAARRRCGDGRAGHPSCGRRARARRARGLLPGGRAAHRPSSRCRRQARRSAWPPCPGHVYGLMPMLRPCTAPKRRKSLSWCKNGNKRGTKQLEVSVPSP